MNKYFYFNQETETLIEFKCNDISKENFYEDILRIGAKKNPINPTELFQKLNSDELDNLLFDLSCRPEVAKNLFYIKDTSNSEYYLTLKDSFMEKVLLMGANNNMGIMKIVGSTSGILQASNLFLERNLIKI